MTAWTESEILASSALAGGMEYSPDNTDKWACSFVDTLRVIIGALELRDPYTRGHSARVAGVALAIARELGWSGDHLLQLEITALLHDIGKIGVQDGLLQKPGPLTAEERLLMQRHPILGAQMLEGVRFLAPVVPCVRHEHEHYDGRGYPDGLAGDKIPLGARIVAVADAWDAMTSARPYRQPVDASAALTEILKHAGTQFDPLVTQALERACRKKALT